MLKQKLIDLVRSGKIRNSALLWSYIDVVTMSVIDSSFGKNKTEKLYNWLYYPRRECHNCSSPEVTFKNFIHGYHRFCSPWCAGEWFRNNATDEEKNEKNNKISLSHRSKTQDEIHEIEKKTKVTKLLKYGDASFNNTTKNKETMYLKYGVEHALQVKEFNTKFKETLKNKDWSETISLRRKTFLDTTGVDHQLKIPEIMKKVKETNLKRYGVENPSQCSEIAERKIKSSYRRKEFTLPSGKTVMLQGYEGHTLTRLLETFDESEITVEQKNMPTIWYELDGETHRYFPDMFIAKENRIIEVKSDHTMRLHLRKNIAKRNRCLELGYSFTFEIYNSRLELLDEKYFLF